VKKRRLIPALLLLVASLSAGPLFADISVSQPFSGVTFIQRSETTPLPLKLNIIEIDLAAQGISFLVTPPSGPRETANQTTLEFLTQLRAQIAINAHFFTPWPLDGTGYSWIIGLAASAGTVYSAFERNKGYPYQDNLPALNISADNTASVVYQAEGDTTGYAVDPPVALYNAVSGNEQILTQGVNTAGTGSWGQHTQPAHDHRAGAKSQADPVYGGRAAAGYQRGLNYKRGGPHAAGRLWSDRGNQSRRRGVDHAVHGPHHTVCSQCARRCQQQPGYLAICGQQPGCFRLVCGRL
jgi:hypothetical protein